MAERAGSRAEGASETGGTGVRFETVRLKYCERCGALGIQSVAQPDSTPPGYCIACRETLRWLAGEVRS